MNGHRRWTGRAFAVVALALGLLISGCTESPARLAGTSAAGRSAEPTDTLSFAETWEFWTAPTLVADALDLYEEQGLEVRVAKFPTGLAAKNAVVNRSTDLGLVADTPVAVSGFLGEDIRLIATYFESNSIVRLVARGGGEEIGPDFVLGRRVGFVRGTISEIYLERMIEEYKLDRSKIRTATFQPNELPYALARGDIDAFVGWEPLGIFARRELGDQVTSWTDPRLYTVSLHLVTRPDVLAGKERALRKFLRAIDAAREQIATDPVGTRRLVEHAVKLRPGELEPYWRPGSMRLDFPLKLDRDELVRRLEREARWLLESGNVPGNPSSGSLPAYERLIDPSLIEGAGVEATS